MQYSDVILCPDCDGTGGEYCPDCDDYGKLPNGSTCPTCKGTCYVSICETCKGTGMMEVNNGSN